VKDDFVAMVSHELRTPLNAILGWTQLMMKGRDDPSVIDRGLDVVARNTRIQAQLISDLLDISRITAGKLRLEIQSVDLVSIITDAIETVQQEADSKGIEVRRELDVKVGPIAGDPARLQQVTWNLVSNAIKFTPRGGHVVVTLRHVGSDAELAVSDSGAGIRPEFLPHVFDRFQQADHSITRRFGGLGLGLSIVKHLVELHGGAVQAASGGEGKGATFTITLPSSDVTAIPSRPSSADAALNHSSSTVSLDAITVLVVEDEPDTREFLKRLLETYGAKVVVAGSAAEALSVFPSARPDILVSDIGLPGVDGYDLMQQIREKSVSDGGRIPAIALTAYVRSEDRTRALTVGYQAHVAKPVEPSELVATIASLVRLSRS
jgi:CheY-like chemotaxis protein/two-component sensor histidine kinase